MEVLPWHLETSYIGTGWHVGIAGKEHTHQPMLPNLRRLPKKAPLPTTEDVPAKANRPLSALAAQSQGQSDHDHAADAQRRLLPTPTCDWRRRRGESHLVTALAEARGAAAIHSPSGAGRRFPTVAPKVENIPSHGVRECLPNAFFEDAFTSEGRLLEILASTPKAERLLLADHRWFQPYFLERLSVLTPQLQELNLRGTQASDATVAAFVSNCPDLRALDVSDCELLTDITCVGSLAELRILRAARCGQRGNAVTSATLAAFGGGATKLEHIDLSFCPGVDEAGLQALAAGCSDLTHLELAGCPGLNDDGILAICAANTALQRLSLPMNSQLPTDERVARAVQHLPLVRELDFAGCHQLGRQLGLAIARHCVCIQVLNLAKNDLGDPQMLRIFSQCPNLKHFDISGCLGLTDESMTGVHQARKLETLVLTNVANLSDEAIDQMLERCPHLRLVREARSFVDAKDLTLTLGPVKVQASAKPKPTKASKKDKKKKNKK